MNNRKRIEKLWETFFNHPNIDWSPGEVETLPVKILELLEESEKRSKNDLIEQMENDLLKNEWLHGYGIPK